YYVLRTYIVYSAVTMVYVLSLHDALSDLSLPRSVEIALPCASQPTGERGPGQGAGVAFEGQEPRRALHRPGRNRHRRGRGRPHRDRKSTRLNSSHVKISYAVFCLKKKNTS